MNPSARPIAWTAFLGGTLASVAANVAHARLAPLGAPATWQPTIGPQIAAAFWPLALLAAVEVLTRVPWPSGWLWFLARYGGTGAVALGAAMLSYRHMAALLASWGEDWPNAHVGPLVVDGLMVVAGTALLALGKTEPAPVEEAEPAAPVEETPSATPEPKPATPEPATPSAKPATDSAKRQAAKDEWLREHRATGRDINGTELGAMFEMSPAWGRARRAEARKETDGRKLVAVQPA